MILCEKCGHRAKHHTGVGTAGYNAPMLACTFEKDRYEVCTCRRLKVNHTDALKTLVAVDEREYP